MLEGLSVDPSDQESQQLPAEARVRVPVVEQPQRTSAEQTVQYTYTQPSSKSATVQNQSDERQPLITEEEYLEIVRNVEATRGGPSSPSPKYIYTATATTPSPSSPSPTVTIDKQRPTIGLSAYKKPVYQPSHPQQQYAQQLNAPQYQANNLYRPTTYADYSEKDSYAEKSRVELNNHKKHADSPPKTKYDPNRGQYHQEKYAPQKYTSFKPSYQLSVTRYHQQPQIQQPQAQALQSLRKPIHYQPALRHSQIQHAQPQLQSVAQVQTQPLFYQDSNIAYNSYQPQAERLVSAHYVSNAEENGQEKQQTVQQESVEYQSPNRYLPEPNEQKQPRIQSVVSKYQYFDPSDPDASPKEKSVKVINPPQLQYEQRQQYGEPVQQYHKLKHQPQSISQQQQQSHPQHQTLRQQHQSQTRHVLQPSQPDNHHVASSPSRPNIFISQGTAAQNSPPAGDKAHAQIPAGHVTHSETLPARAQEIRIPLTSPKRPLTQAEFQALVDAGYRVQGTFNTNTLHICCNIF